MNSQRWHDNPLGLEALAAQAANYAWHMMKATGIMPPTVIAVTDEGLIFCMPDSNGHLDTKIPPSQSPNRREIVALMLEDHNNSATRMLFIQRDAADAFTKFDDSQSLQFGESRGRFSGLCRATNPACVRPPKQKPH